MRKPAFGVFGIAALTLTLAACGGGDGRTALVVYSPHGSDMLEAFEKRFEQAHPDVDVQAVDMGSQEVLDRLRSERANPQADVWWGAPANTFEDAARDLSLPVEFGLDTMNSFIDWSRNVPFQVIRGEGECAV